ncbi:hypothetical protein [Sorangium cellulosum]|uniref:hypothetical protein n=1 Tax=Sorangium cellulosum TaxID=56 RepID=UPI00138ABB06|nr:hypothetical protein [Sorangium cellulosum]
MASERNMGILMYIALAEKGTPTVLSVLVGGAIVTGTTISAGEHLKLDHNAMNPEGLPVPIAGVPVEEMAERVREIGRGKDFAELLTMNPQCLHMRDVRIRMGQTVLTAPIWSTMIAAIQGYFPGELSAA